MSKREKSAGAQMIDAKKGKMEIDLDQDLQDSFGPAKNLKSVGDKIIEKAPVKHDKSKQKTIDAVSNEPKIREPKIIEHKIIEPLNPKTVNLSRGTHGSKLVQI